MITESPYSTESFWAYVEERHRIWERKEVEKLPPPWTDNPILSKYHFCNVRRKIDHGSRWYIQHVALVYESHEDLLWRTCFYRLVNNVDYFERLGGIPSLADWERDSGKVESQIHANGKPWSPAHIILQWRRATSRTENLLIALSELSSHLACFSLLMAEMEHMESVWNLLQKTKFMGRFVTLQVVRDLILAGAGWSEDEWCYIGPGAKAGLECLYGYAGAAQQQEQMIALRRSPANKLDLNLCDIEHCICEYAKYTKFSQGKGRRRLYKSRRAL